MSHIIFDSQKKKWAESIYDGWGIYFNIAVNCAIIGALVSTATTGIGGITAGILCGVPWRHLEEREGKSHSTNLKRNPPVLDVAVLTTVAISIVRSYFFLFIFLHSDTLF